MKLREIPMYKKNSLSSAIIDSDNDADAVLQSRENYRFKTRQRTFRIDIRKTFLVYLLNQEILES